MTSPSARTAAKRANTLRGEHVLFVVGGRTQRKILLQLLAAQGAEAIAADDAEHCWSILNSRSLWPHLILVDMHLPGGQSLELCWRIKSDSRFGNIPIVMLSTGNQAGTDDEALAPGVDETATHPTEGAALAPHLAGQLREIAEFKAFESHASLEAVIAAQESRLGQVREGQQALLTDVKQFVEPEMAVRLVSALEAGGDFYEVRRLSDSEFGFLVADVAGHDLSSTYITGALKALCATFMSEALNVEEAMQLLNASLLRFLTEDQYVTACYAKYHLLSRELEVTCAGHPSPLLQEPDGSCRFVDLIGDILGMYERPQFQVDRFPVSPGERLFLFSDGLTEGFRDSAGRSGSRLYGTARLLKLMAELADATIDRVVTSVTRQVEKASDHLADDILLFGCRF